MSKFNKSYRIRTDIGKDTSVHVKLDRDYDILEIMSLKIDQINDYKLHTSDYGVIAGRVLANDAFGIPNAKISVFISTDTNDNDVLKNVLYPYNTTSSKNKNNIRYNLLPDEQITNCHTIIGTFPEKQYVLDNEDILEVFDKYYKYTTRTNNAGDYMIFGVPVGNQTVHVDIDLSDIGILSQKPYDMAYKGYNIEQFENPNKFKHSTNLENLTQVISQDNVTDVIPFWGDQDEGTIGITRCDIKIQYKFEPTCVFMGSVVSDTASNGISKKCIPSPGMGAMDEITTGSGTIEMIRKTPSGDVEEFQVKGTQLINGDGVWCYQIPMNLDYMMTDEFGNMVPTYDPDKGIPTRTRVRFRISMQDFDSDSINMFRCKMLVPHNPNIYSDNCENELDYNYGTNTKETSYRDLFWNCVYSVKSYIPRIQRGSNWKNEKFTGFKRVNYYNDKNPIPYNNIRIRLPFMYRVLCVVIKSFIKVTGLVNWFLNLIAGIIVTKNVKDGDGDDGVETDRPTFISLSGNLCGDHLENVCYIPGVKLENLIGKDKGTGRWALGRKTLLGYALLKFYVDVSGNKIDLDLPKIETTAKGRLYIDQEDGNYTDKNSIDYKNKNDDNEFWCEARNSDGSPSDEALTLHGIRFTDNVNYLIQCIEMNLAQEYKVIQFDFYNDWINGLIYIPRWMRNIRKKRTFLGMTITKERIKACNENFSKKNNRNIVQQCGVKFSLNEGKFNSITTDVGCGDNNNCHKDKSVRLEKNIFNDGGIVHSQKTSKDQYVYYFKPYENSDNQNIRLFATDIILLGTLNENDKWGIPRGIDELVSSTYQMPPNLALTDSMLEGDEYVLPAKNITMFFGANTFRVHSILYGTEDKTHLSSLDLATETGSYTELSGVNWNYTGPLQEMNDGYYSENGLYKPGGHFLGLTCRNSQTTIKTCVNLNRICEYGVWMSQRQDIKEDFSTTPPTLISTTPIGFISGDEIKGSKYRRIFSTLNSNNLKVQRDENGFFKYDFTHLTPTNFGGELSNHIKNKDLYNRLMQDYISEKEYNVNDNEFTDFGVKSTENVNNKIIVRTNEFLDKEYYKFRFGLDDKTIKKDDEIKKRFLIYEEPFAGIKNVSFPMFNNSFYFYFGLHDGRTALDELKKNYFAVCEKHTLNYTDELNKDKYLTIEALENELTVQLSVSNCQYSFDAMNWVNLSANTPTQPINKGSKLYFKSDLIKSVDYRGVGTFTISKKCNLSGNCNSLLFGDNVEMNYDLKNKNNVFHKLFYNCDNIIDASQLKLPATTLSDRCYESMFAGCTSLVLAPELPATTLTDSCYEYMFSRCTSLTTAPELPATKLASRCYQNMFNDCKTLKVAPELPATTLADSCYQNMFFVCTSLTTAPDLPATALSEWCYSKMFYGCTSLTTAPELPVTELVDSCYESMFYKCTSLVSVPSILPATTLSDGCYYNMFFGCTSLTKAPELPATELTDSCYESMFYNCSSLVTAPELPAKALSGWCYDSMFRGCTSLIKAPELPAATLSVGCYDSMFYGCSKLSYIKAMFNHNIINDSGEYEYTSNWVEGVSPTGTFVKNTTATWNVTGSNGIPEGWVKEYEGELDYMTIECITNCSIAFSQISAIEWCEYNSEGNYKWEGRLSSGVKTFTPGKYVFRRCLQYDGEGRQFTIHGKCNLSGSVMSILYVGDEFKEKNSIIEGGYSLKRLFENCTGITNVSACLLPATTLSDGCYDSMFAGCTSLKTAPELPATNLTDSCYYRMFEGCTSLTEAPVLPATTLTDYCYGYMFKDCYDLNKIKMLAQEGESDSCMDDWVKSVSKSGTFIKYEGFILEYGTSGIPEGWEVKYL